MSLIRRPIAWFGSKERMCATIHALIPPRPDTWVDLFCGSAIVTLRKARHPNEVINDRHGEIVNLFDVLRDPCQAAELYRQVELTPYAEEILYRAYETTGSTPVERAYLFLITRWFGRGGDAHRTGFRWSKSQASPPEMTWARLPSRLAAVAERLRGICIRSADALKIVGDYDSPRCILFVDPPYPGHPGRRYAVKMSAAQHQNLAERLRRSRAAVILTMNPGTVYDEVLSGWARREVLVQGNDNAVKTEIILTNFEPPAVPR